MNAARATFTYAHESPIRGRTDPHRGGENTGFIVKINCTLGAGFLLSLALYFFAVHANSPALAHAAWPFVLIFGGVWGIFVLFTLVGRAMSFRSQRHAGRPLWQWLAVARWRRAR